MSLSTHGAGGEVGEVRSPFSWKRVFAEAAARFPILTGCWPKNPERECARIIAEVAAKHRLSVRDILGHLRWHPIVMARHEAYWRCRNEISVRGQPLSSPRIGKVFGRDHTTILYGAKRHEERNATNAHLTH